MSHILAFIEHADDGAGSPDRHARKNTIKDWLMGPGAPRIVLLSILVAMACCVAMAWAGVAEASPRDATARGARAQAPAPASTPQTEPTNLDEGKTPAQFFASSCAVCHQSGQGLAKGRGAGTLASFLRQHYTTSSAQANTLAGYLASGTFDRGRPATPARATPGERPSEPATARRPAPKHDKPDAKPDEARKPDPAVAAAPPARRVRIEDGKSAPVEGLVVLPPGATDVPSDKDKATDKPADKAADKPAAPAGGSAPKQAEAPAPMEAAAPPKPPAIVSPLTEEKPIPAQVPEIPL